MSVDPITTQNVVVGGGGAIVALLVRELRLWRRDEGEGRGKKRDRQEQRIDKLFMEIGQLRGRIDELSASNATLLAAKAGLEVELSLVTDERDELRAKVAALEAGIQRRRAGD